MNQAGSTAILRVQVEWCLKDADHQLSNYPPYCHYLRNAQTENDVVSVNLMALNTVT